MREARIRSLAKVNLDLRILHKRPDGFHELRTVFQTISLADEIHLTYTPGRRTEFESDLNLPDDLLVRAAESLARNAGIRGKLHIQTRKQIPMGGGLGGGSSNAGAILLALPVLAGVRVPLQKLMELGAELGSDVPFFLLGGTVLGVGRGTELYPLPDLGIWPGILIAPGVHVSTARAYSALGRQLTSENASSILRTFQSVVWRLAERVAPAEWKPENEFEPVVFQEHPQLEAVRRRLVRLGARPALMSGSGSSMFGIFADRESREQALRSLRIQGNKAERDRDKPERDGIYSISLVTARGYRALWHRQLRAHVEGKAWPPQSRYVR